MFPRVSPTKTHAVRIRPPLLVMIVLICLFSGHFTLMSQERPKREIARDSIPELCISSVATPTAIATPTPTAASLGSPLTSEADASGGVKLIDITKLKSDPFILKKEGFQEAGQELGKKLEVLEASLATGTGSWFRREVLWGISRLKLALGLCLFLVLLVFDFLLRRLIGRQMGKFQFEKPTLRALARASESWLDTFLVAIQPPLSLFLWGYGGLTIVAFLMSQVEETDELSWITGSAGQVAELCGLVSFFWCLFRLITVLDLRLRKWADTTPSHWDNLLVPFVGRVLRFFMPFLATILALPILKLPPTTISLVQSIVSITLIGAIAWILIELVQVVEKGALAPFDSDLKEDLAARQVYTQVHILKKVLLTVIGVIALAMMLMVFDSVRQLGTSILASAGVLGIIVGFAAQRSISTLLAGVQIALTQPMRIGDVVIVEGEWGWVEEVSLTYVVVKVWDLRRIVLPIGFFLEKPFQNWTRTSAKILGTVYFYVDYTFPVEAMREPLKRIVSASPNWDGDVCGVQVTDTNERRVEIRALVSAEDSSKAWDLRCEVREKILEWLQKDHPQSLPKTRVEISPLPEAGKAHQRHA